MFLNPSWIHLVEILSNKEVEW